MYAVVLSLDDAHPHYVRDVVPMTAVFRSASSWTVAPRVCPLNAQDTLDARWSDLRRAWCAAVSAAREHRARAQGPSTRTSRRRSAGAGVASKRSRR